MRVATLTQRHIDAAMKGDRTRRIVLPDQEVRGLYVQVHKKSLSYVYSYRPRGTDPETGKRFGTRHYKIGDHASHSLLEAREAAAALRRRVHRGGDPKREAAEQTAAAETARKSRAARASCADRLTVYADVLAQRGSTKRHQADELRQVRLALTAVDALTLPPADITADIIERVLSLCRPGSRSARFGALHRFLSWAMRGKGVPVTLIFDRHERPKPPKARGRVLSGDEMAALWRAAAMLPNPAVTDLVHFLLAVPCRRGEAAHMRWQDLALDRLVWHQPTSKNGQPHDFPLNALALAILQRRRTQTARAPDLVFPGPRESKPYSAWSNLMDALNARAPGIADWVLHDIRRTFATHLAERGHDETLLDLTINHKAARSRSGVRGVYQRALRWPERVAALAAWNQLLEQQLADVDVASRIALRRVG